MKNKYFQKTPQKTELPLFRGMPAKDTELLFKVFSPDALLREPLHYGLLASIRMRVYHMLETFDQVFADVHK